MKESDLSSFTLIIKSSQIKIKALDSDYTMLLLSQITQQTVHDSNLPSNFIITTEVFILMLY